MRAAALLLCAAALAAPLRAEVREGEHAATQAARALYAWVLEHPGAGLPDAAALDALAPVLTPSLRDLLAAGRATEQRCVGSVAPDEKPPLFEADVFVDTYEGATEVVLAPALVDGEVATANARLLLVMDHFPKAHRHRAVAWDDVVQLRHGPDGWRVDDVAFASGDRLRTRVGDFVDAHRDCLAAPSDD